MNPSLGHISESSVKALLPPEVLPKGFEWNIPAAAPAHGCGSSGPCSDAAASGQALAAIRFAVGTSSVSSSPTMKAQRLLQLFQQREIYPASAQIHVYGDVTHTQRTCRVVSSQSLHLARARREGRGASGSSKHPPPTAFPAKQSLGDKGVMQHRLLGAGLLFRWAGIDLNLLTWNCTHGHWGAPGGGADTSGTSGTWAAGQDPASSKARWKKPKFCF